MNRFFLLVLFSVAVALLIQVSPARAYEIEDFPNVPVERDIVLGPAKTELSLEPGQQATKELIITNRTGEVREFSIGVEDFLGSQDTNQTIIFLGDQKGPYSLKDYVHFELDSFILEHGQRMRLPVQVNIPADAEAGGLYGAVFISAFAPASDQGEVTKDIAEGQIKLVTKLGSLFFVRVKGEVVEDGFFESFTSKKAFYRNGPVMFQLLFQNDGNIHLVPYGGIEIDNILGKRVATVEVDPWFAMPDSLRLREVEWQRKLLFGRYTAKAQINRGYQDIIDEKEVTFWVIPWHIVLAVLAVLFIVIFVIVWLLRHVEIRVKRK